MRSNTDFGGKIITKWEYIKNKRSYFHLSYSHSRLISISLSSLVPIPMRIHSHGNLAFRIPMHISSSDELQNLKKNKKT